MYTRTMTCRHLHVQVLQDVFITMQHYHQVLEEERAMGAERMEQSTPCSSTAKNSSKQTNQPQNAKTKIGQDDLKEINVHSLSLWHFVSLPDLSLSLSLSPPPRRMRACRCARAHARARAHTHTHTLILDMPPPVGLVDKRVQRRAVSEVVPAGTEIPKGGGRGRLHLKLVHRHLQKDSEERGFDSSGFSSEGTANFCICSTSTLPQGPKSLEDVERGI